MDADAVAVVQPPHLLFSAGCGREQRRKLFITNPSRVERLAFKVRTNAPDRVSVDVAAGVVEPRCTRAVRVFWTAGDGGAAAAATAAAATGDVVVVSSRRLPAGTPLPEAASAALLGRDVGDAAPDAVLPVVALPRCADADGAAARLRAAAVAAGPAQATALVRALVDVLYCEGVVSAEGAVLAAGAAALALAPSAATAAATTKRAARPVTPDAPPPAPATPGASPDGGGGVRALPPPAAAATATADDVADELLACLDRLTAVMDAARCGGPKPGAVGGGGGVAAATTAVAEPVADRVKFFDSLFSYTA